MVPGVLVTLAVAGTCLYTSLILWKFCLKHPEIRDICDIGQKLFGGSQWAYNVTSLFFVLNNVFIQGKRTLDLQRTVFDLIQALHVLVGARLLNTLSNSAECTVVFGVRSFFPGRIHIQGIDVFYETGYNCYHMLLHLPSQDAQPALWNGGF